MATWECRRCGEPFVRGAGACPHCSYPEPRPPRLGFTARLMLGGLACVVFCSGLVLGIGYLLSEPPLPEEPAVAAAAAAPTTATTPKPGTRTAPRTSDPSIPYVPDDWTPDDVLPLKAGARDPGTTEGLATTREE